MNSAAFFDMDGVLLRGESQFSFLLWCVRHGVAPQLRALPVLVRYACYVAGLSHDALNLRQSGFELLRDVPVEEMQRSASRFFQKDFARRLRRQATPLLETHRRSGHSLVLVTSACEPVALPVASRLKLNATIATRLIVNRSSYTGQRALPEPYGEGKRLLVELFCEEHSISPDDCFAYGDHHSDAALLECVGHPVAANPNRKLESLARVKGWPIVDLDGPTLPAVIIPRVILSC